MEWATCLHKGRARQTLPARHRYAQALAGENRQAMRAGILRHHPPAGGFLRMTKRYI